MATTHAKTQFAVDRLFPALVGIIFLLIIPTGAAIQAGAFDAIGPHSSIVLSPSNGPNGQYATIDDPARELTVNLSNPAGNASGVNPNAITTVERVFTITNVGDTPQQVWIVHTGVRRALTIYDQRSGKPLKREENVTLTPGQTIEVSVRVDTTDRSVSTGDTLLTKIVLHTRELAAEEVTATPRPGGGRRTGGGDTGTPTPTPSPDGGSGTGGSNGTGGGSNPGYGSGTGGVPVGTPGKTTVQRQSDGGLVATSDGVSISTTDVAESDLSSKFTVTELSVPDPRARDGPAAVITQAGGTTSATLSGSISTAGGVGGVGGNGGAGGTGGGTTNQTRVREALKLVGADTVTIVHNQTTLVGTHSLFASKESIDDKLRMIRQVDISVPPELENRSTRIEFTVPESKFGETDPSHAVVAHHTADGWQLLETSVVSRENGNVTLSAITNGFSPFAVFAENSVAFTWQVEGEHASRSGQRIDVAFPELGIYNVTLTVRDAFGLTDTTHYKVLVDDVPKVRVETVDKNDLNRTATLHATVKNQVGNTTVRWTFPDGTTATGTTVRHRFRPGEHTARVRVVDTYGATAKRDHAVGFGLGALVPAGVPFEMRVIVASIGVGLSAIVMRWQLFRLLVFPFVGHHPEIVRPEEIEIDLVDGGFVVDNVRAEDVRGDLDTLELTVLDDEGAPLGATALSFGRTDEYLASPVTIRTPADRPLPRGERYTLSIRSADADGNSQTKRFDVADAPESTPTPTAGEDDDA
ncbi:MAG: PKD domain-containing protein [Salinigranum sp.]